MSKGFGQSFPEGVLGGLGLLGQLGGQQQQMNPLANIAGQGAYSRYDLERLFAAPTRILKPAKTWRQELQAEISEWLPDLK